MNEADKTKIQDALFKVIEKLTNQDEFLETLCAGFHWGKNTTHYMAAAATNVLVCAIEAEEEDED